MVNHKRKYVFVHIPKTAGVSFYTALGGARWQQHHDTLAEHNDPTNRKGRLVKHTPWTPDYFKFTVIRNPWDRMLSAYSYFKRGGRSDSDRFNADIVRSFGSFDVFVKGFDKVEDRFNNRHFLPQTFWFDPDYPYDFIGRFETLERDFTLIADRLDYHGLALPHVNPSKHKHYTERYTPEMREIVGQIYADDIAKFGYTFDGS